MTDISIFSSIQNSLSKLDLFSTPYQSFLSEDRQKFRKTFVGGLLSLIISLTSFSYLIYLCNLYFQNLIQPTISLLQQQHGQAYSLYLPQDFMILRIKLSNQQNIIDYEKQRGKKLISSNIQLNYTDDNGIDQSKFFHLTPCLDEKLSGYFCIDYQDTFKKDEKIPLRYMNQDKNDSIMFTITECKQELIKSNEECEGNSTLINELVFHPLNEIRAYIKLQQYNTFTKKVEDKIKFERIMLDDKLAMINLIELKNNDISIIDGFIIQSTQQQTIIDDYKRIAVSSTQEIFQKTYNISTYATFFFSPEQYTTKQTIQYHPFTSLFAQFLSVFNALLLLGYFFKKFSEAQLFEDLLQIQLITQYKQTAVDLIKNKLKSNDQGSYELYKYITAIDFKQKIQNIIGLGFFRRVYLYSGKASSKRYLKEENQQFQTLNKLIQFTNKQNNIFDMLQRLMELEIMIRLLFTPEQYAAIKLCGMRVCVDENDNKIQAKIKEKNQKNINNISELYSINKEMQIVDKEMQVIGSKTHIEEKQNVLNNVKIEIQGDPVINQEKNQELIEQKQIKNHLETIESIECDQTQFQELVSKFVDQIKNNKQQISELDKRIFHSMISVNFKNQNEIQ